MNNRIPTVGSWYKDLQQGFVFEVVAVDEAAQTVETQHSDGEISEFDLDSWRELILDAIDEPEDWRSPFELGDDDSYDPESAFHQENWSGPLNEIEPDFIAGLDDY